MASLSTHRLPLTHLSVSCSSNYDYGKLPTSFFPASVRLASKTHLSTQLPRRKQYLLSTPRSLSVKSMAPPKPGEKPKKVIKLALEAGKATPAPPVWPALGSKGVNIMAFCKDYNGRTADKAGYVIPVEITVYDISASNLIEVLGCLVGLEKLDMDEEFLQSLAVDAVPRRLPNAYYHLMILELNGLKFHDLGVLSATLCLVRSSPNLKELVIWADSDVDANMEPVTEFLRVQDGVDCSLNVKLKWFSGVTPELEFIKFLLIITPVLETMSVHIYRGGILDAIVESRVLKELIQFPRVSPNVKIVVDS